jgi:hypothetical protein
MSKWSDKLAEISASEQSHGDPYVQCVQLDNEYISGCVQSQNRNLQDTYCPNAHIAHTGGLVRKHCAAVAQNATAGWLEALLTRPRPENEPLARWQTRCAGVRRFVEDGWHDRALALGWSTYALYGRDESGAYGAAWFIEGDRVLFVTDNLIMACRKDGFARPIYRGVDYSGPEGGSR